MTTTQKKYFKKLNDLAYILAVAFDFKSTLLSVRKSLESHPFTGIRYAVPIYRMSHSYSKLTDCEPKQNHIQVKQVGNDLFRTDNNSVFSGYPWTSSYLFVEKKELADTITELTALATKLRLGKLKGVSVKSECSALINKVKNKYGIEDKVIVETTIIQNDAIKRGTPMCPPDHFYVQNSMSYIKTKFVDKFDTKHFYNGIKMKRIPMNKYEQIFLTENIDNEYDVSVSQEIMYLG